MGKRLELTGRRFGRLIAIKPVGKYRTSMLWLCKCDCGNEKVIKCGSLQNGDTVSCGCFHHELAKIINITHGGCVNGKQLPEYKAWQSMKDRCYNANSLSYPNYGERGISVCERWLHSFENFLSDMGKKPSPKHSLDRYPNNETGNYEPTNCRWATSRQQNENKRNSVWIEYNGKKTLLADVSNHLGISHSLIKYHLTTGKSIEQILNRLEVRMLSKIV